MEDDQTVLETVSANVRARDANDRIRDVLSKIEAEVVRAMHKHPGSNASRHHHYGVIAEEFREFETCVFKDFVPGGREEAIQVAATVVRFLLETPAK